MELASMDLGDDQPAHLGEGPENQSTNVKWVSSIDFTICSKKRYDLITGIKFFWADNI